MLAEPSALCSSIREKCSMLLMDNFSCRVKITSFIIKKISLVIVMIVQSHMNDHSGTQKQFITNRFKNPPMIGHLELNLFYNIISIQSYFQRPRGKEMLYNMLHICEQRSTFTPSST